jgi:hypothetical protein
MHKARERGRVEGKSTYYLFSHYQVWSLLSFFPLYKKSPFPFGVKSLEDGKGGRKLEGEWVTPFFFYSLTNFEASTLG